jgi:hypothetical protein
MKAVVGPLSVLLFAGMRAVAPQAAAQDIGRWTDPTGAWSLDLTGWKHIENSNLGQNKLFEVEPLTSPEDKLFRMCSASQYDLPPLGGSASTVNSSMARFGLARARAVFGDDVQEVAHTIVDGVTIADVRTLIGAPSTGTRVDYRAFNVATKQGPAMFRSFAALETLSTHRHARRCRPCLIR